LAFLVIFKVFECVKVDKILLHHAVNCVTLRHVVEISCDDQRCVRKVQLRLSLKLN